MKLSWTLLASLVLSTHHCRAATPSKRHYDSHNYYVLEHSATSSVSLEELARTLDVEVVEQAGALEGVWLVRAPKPQFDARSEEEYDPVLDTFDNLRREARSTLHARSSGGLAAREVVESVRFLERQELHELVKRAPPPIRPNSSLDVASRLGIKDPLFGEQWHLVNDEHPQHSMNVTPVWEMGLTGKGVLTAFIDDGLDDEAEDLKDAFSAQYSYDFNRHQDLPKPTGPADHHGTRCAGQVAARRNNACGVGIAHNAMAAGIRILGGPITSVDEAAALNYGYQDVSIYSCSWGPRDNGQTMEGPNYLIRKAVTNGINNGRGGKGSIYVFASGNGGRNGDQCNFDGYTNSIYSVTVGSIDYTGLHPSYSEACAANMIVAYSSGGGKNIVTTDIGKNECSKYHGGTSAAAPNAVGVFTLAMEVRPDLTWRDIQHLCVQTARRVNPDDPDWEKTASGRFFSYKYGYGALDAYAYVTAAKTWKLVKPQAWIHTPINRINNGSLFDLGKKQWRYEGGEPIEAKGSLSQIKITKEMLQENNFETLEHIDVRVWIQHARRGDVEVEVISPNGIRSVLAKAREHDDYDTGFPGWRFMTLKHWGENPIGDWTIKVTDQDDPESRGRFLGWSMALWGSSIDPAKAKKFEEPVIDNALPAVEDPTRPTLDEDHPDATASTVHAKPTDHLPSDHGHAPGENTRPSFPHPTGKPGEDDPSEAWYDHISGLASAQKWFFGALGAVVAFTIGAVVFFWRRRAARQKLAEYRSLAADDIHMDNVGQQGGPATARGGARTSRALYDAFGEPSSDSLPVQAQSALYPPTSRELGFHSGFLDDDEPSAGLHTPKYTDEPSRTPRTGTAGTSQPPPKSSDSSESFSEVNASREHLV